jgi:hypothetical protein
MEIVPRIIRVKLPYIGGEGGSHHLNRKNQPCVLNSFFEDPLSSTSRKLLVSKSSGGALTMGQMGRK